MRTRIYVDGFNLYYGALRGTRFKWLNLVELARQLLPAGHAVDRLNYYTARVSGVSGALSLRTPEVRLVPHGARCRQENWPAGHHRWFGDPACRHLSHTEGRDGTGLPLRCPMR